jgi:hypothetical protein
MGGLTEALLVPGREGRPPDAPELAGSAGRWRGWYRIGDPRPVPSTSRRFWSARRWPDCCGVLGGDPACLIVLEDLHWADPETLAVTELEPC